MQGVKCGKITRVINFAQPFYAATSTPFCKFIMMTKFFLGRKAMLIKSPKNT